MGGSFLRMVSDAELDSIRESQALQPTPATDWHPYSAGKVVLLDWTDVPTHFILSCVRE
jgi:hypothetical protein